MRWDDKRLAVYAEYANALKKVVSIAVRLAAHRGIHPDVDVLSPDEGTRLTYHDHELRFAQ